MSIHVVIGPGSKPLYGCEQRPRWVYHTYHQDPFSLLTCRVCTDISVPSKASDLLLVLLCCCDDPAAVADVALLLLPLLTLLLRTPGFIGCFEEPPSTCGDPNTRALTYLGYDPSMTVAMCIGLAQAAGYSYAALQWQGDCFAGNDTSMYVIPATCDAPCSGDSNQACGGWCANALYLVPSVTPQGESRA